MKKRTNVYILALLVSFAAVASSNIPKICEYWFDGDRSSLKREKVDGDEFEFNVEPREYSVGRHYVTYRLANEEGLWGTPGFYSFLVPWQWEIRNFDNKPKICEYWFDGDRSTLKREIVEGDEFEFNLEPHDYSVGRHYVTYRLANEEGLWGTPGFYSFLVPWQWEIRNFDNKPKICEYWFDGDRSTLKREQVEGDEFEFNVEPRDYSVGRHYVTYRLANEEGLWGTPGFYSFLVPWQWVINHSNKHVAYRHVLTYIIHTPALSA